MIENKTNAVCSFCSDLKELRTKTIHYEQKEMKITLTDNENKFYEEQEKCHMSKRVLLW